jgi:hypothetical protein
MLERQAEIRDWQAVVGVRYPAVVVHGLADARVALATGGPVTLLSGEGAALYAGCLWWRELTVAARNEFPRVAMEGFLDCADESGQALAALRVGLCRLVLWPIAPGWARVAAIVAARRGILLPNRPPALDLAQRGAARRLHDWVRAGAGMDDSTPVLR